MQLLNLLSSFGRIFSRISPIGISLLLVLCLPGLLTGQDFTETITKTLRFADSDNPANILLVRNIHGSVSVVGYDGEEVQVEARRLITGTAEEIRRAREELKLVIEPTGDQIRIYPDAPFIMVEKRKGGLRFNMNRPDDSYNFDHDITIRMPRNTKVDVSTINRGEVRVENSRRSVSAANVNGKITLKNITGTTSARTVNGDITIRYAECPDGPSEYKTVNGTIHVHYPRDLSADITFKSLSGALYTDFPQVKRLEARVEKQTETANGRVIYKVSRKSPLRIGSGGPTHRFQVLNGDVYIRQI